jgi:cytoskeleton protein RodZ
MNTEQTEEQAQTHTQPAPGEVLKQAREKMGWSVRDVADRLRLRVSVIEDLENNNPDTDQLATFTRGYLRSYAKLMQIDADSLIGTSDMEASSAETVQKMQSFSRKTRRQKSESRLMMLSGVIALILVGITGAWYWQNQQIVEPLVPQQAADELVTTPNDTDTMPVAEPLPEAAPQETQSDEPAQAPISDAEPEPSVPASSEGQQATQAVAPESTTSEPSISEQIDEAQRAANDSVGNDNEAPVAADNTLVMRFSSDCWIDVRDATGARLATGIKTNGDALTLNGEPPYQLVLGAPSAVTITFNGDNIDLDGYPTGQVARLRLPQ